MEIPLLTTLTAAQAAVQRDPRAGAEGVDGEKFAGALCGSGFDLAQPNGGVGSGERRGRLG